MNKILRAQRAAAILIVFFILMLAVAAQNAAAQSVVPHFDCAEPVYTDGVLTKFRNYYGYTNTTGGIVTINDGPNNFFSPNPGGQYTGVQVMDFQPGYHPKSFSILVDPNLTITWFVRNQPAFANQIPLKFCGSEGINSITYQGRLSENGTATERHHDFIFRFYDVPTGGTPLGVIEKTGVPVTNGVFTVQLYTDQIFTDNAGNVRYLEISVRKTLTSESYTTLTPRQALTSVPFAVTAKNVSGGFVKIPEIPGVNAPPASQCNNAAAGQMTFNRTNLYICVYSGTSAGYVWKTVALQSLP